MSPSSTPALAAARALSPSLLPLLLMLMPRLVAAAEPTAANGSCDMKSCALLEASLLEEYVSGLNASGLPLAVEDSAGNGTLLPFGALPADWSRLLLLQNSQPEGTPLRESLLRLSRLILAAYFDSQERHDWTDQLLTGDHGRASDVAAGAASEPESEDQQANNATSDSTAQKGSTRINASSIDVAAYNNEGSQPSGGNFSGNEDDSTTSHYSAALLPTAEGANFNQTFSSAADNETSGSKSNETSLRGESTSGPLFLGDDGSAANEVLHEHSREELLQRLKEESPSDSDEWISFEFNSTKSLEDFFASPEEKSDRIVDQFFATEATANETEAPLTGEDFFASSEENATLSKSVEDVIAASDELGTSITPSDEDFFSTSEAAITPRPIPENPSSPGDSSAAAGIPTTRDSVESRKNEDNPGPTTPMARLISGGISPGDETAADRSPGRTDAATAIPTTPAGSRAAVENRTTDRPDDLFSEPATTQRRPGDGWNSTSGSIEPASDGEKLPATVASVRIRRSTLQYFQRESSSAAAATAQPVPPASSDGDWDSREENAMAKPRNRHQRRVRRNKRRTRKRAGVELDVEGQYPSFDGREPGQALLTEERLAENSARSLQ